jgi:hypothetical protein
MNATNAWIAMGSDLGTPQPVQPLQGRARYAVMMLRFARTNIPPKPCAMPGLGSGGPMAA